MWSHGEEHERMIEIMPPPADPPRCVHVARSFVFKAGIVPMEIILVSCSTCQLVWVRDEDSMNFVPAAWADPDWIPF
jgi:hypothetical protein